jgi:hypothetical protein
MRMQSIPGWCDDNSIRAALELTRALRLTRQQRIQAVEDALDKLDATMSTQDKRGAYSAKDPTKVRWSDAQAFQELVIQAAGRIARSQERPYSGLQISEETMIVRWIAYLCQIARYNAFGMSVAYAKVLHDTGLRSTQHAADFYDVLQQAPGTKDDSQFPRKRAALLAKMQQRFAAWVDFEETASGEIAFPCHRDPNMYRPLMHRLLHLLAPWHVKPPEIPADFDPERDVIPNLRTPSSQPEDLNQVEIRRIHAILNPGTCSRILRGLERKNDRAAAARGRGPEGPWKLVLPQFKNVNAFPLFDSDSGGSPTPLSQERHDDEDIDTIRGHFQQRRARRHKTTAPTLRVVVDDEPVVEFSLLEKDSAVIRLHEQDEWLEIYDVSEEQPALLAAVQSSDLSPENVRMATMLRRGQRVTAIFEPLANGQRRVTITYSESRLGRRLILACRRLIFHLHPRPAYAIIHRLGGAERSAEEDKEQTTGTPPRT